MEPFDASTLVVGGVALLPLVFGTTQFLKEMLDVGGKRAKLLAFLVAVAYSALFVAVPYIPEPYHTLATSVVMVLASAMSAMGLYQFATREKTPAIPDSFRPEA